MKKKKGTVAMMPMEGGTLGGEPTTAAKEAGQTIDPKDRATMLNPDGGAQDREQVTKRGDFNENYDSERVYLH